VFLDDDELCSLQKKYGHDYLPRTCQAFPFGFVRNERQEVVAQISRLCPSIRDDRGTPIDRRLLATKLAQRGGAERMAKVMSTLERRVLSQDQYLRVVRHWDERLSESQSPATALADLYDFTCAFEQALASGPEYPGDRAVQAALMEAWRRDPERLVVGSGTPLHARLLFAYLLGNLCHPGRSLLPQRIRRPSLLRLQGLRALLQKLYWLIERGSVDLMYVPQPVKLQCVATVPRFLAEAEGSPVREYLRLVLQRRQVFVEPRYLLGVLLDLGLATTVISRFARCRASAAGRSGVTTADVHEGIAVAELVLLSHASHRDQGRLMRNLRVSLLGSRARFRRVIGTEA
jgi:lysine-N-methylase